MNYLKNVYTELYQHKGVLIDEQNTGDFNPLYEAMHDVYLKHACS